MKAGVELVRKPVRLICIFFGSGIYQKGKVTELELPRSRLTG